MMSRWCAATLALLATVQLAGAFVATPGGLSLRAPGRMQVSAARVQVAPASRAICATAWGAPRLLRTPSEGMLGAHIICNTSEAFVLTEYPVQMATARTSPRMAEQAEQEPESVAVESETRVKGLEARSTSWLSRNLSEERRNQRTFYDIEKRGELLKAPDRAADGAWGEELTEIGKWQRTNGPIYIQATGGLMLVAGFANYFGAANANGLSQPLWCTSILVALLGFALQRKGGD